MLIPKGIFETKRQKWRIIQISFSIFYIFCVIISIWTLPFLLDWVVIFVRGQALLSVVLVFVILKDRNRGGFYSSPIPVFWLLITIFVLKRGFIPNLGRTFILNLGFLIFRELSEIFSFILILGFLKFSSS